MNILEKDIEELLFEALKHNHSLLRSRGLKVHHKDHYLKQPYLGNYGRPDIVGYSLGKKIGGFRNIYVSIFELKKEKINYDTLKQACKYKSGIIDYFKMFCKNVEVTVDINLIGRSLEETSEFTYILSSLSDVDIFIYKLDLENGLKFDYVHPNFYLRSPDFVRPDLSIAYLRPQLDSKLLMDELPY
jgi:hypothetical protein